MTGKKVTKKRVKAGTSKASAADKKVLFAEAYLSNGENALQAAISAGFSPKSAGSQGSRLLKDVNVLSIIDSRRIQVVAKAQLDTETLVEGIARIAFSDPRKLAYADGRVKRLHELDDVTAAAVASFKVNSDGSIEYKLWDKNSAQERACKIVGLFERDNKQKTDPLLELLQSLGGNVLGVTVGRND